MRATVSALLPAGVLLVLLIGCDGAEAPSEPTFAAAASLRNVMPELLAAWGHDARVTYGGSGTLRRQVETGAPIDGVLFASPGPVDALLAKGLADPATRARVATNRLVLVGPADAASTIAWTTLPTLGADQKLALGEAATVPAGHYAREALRGLGIWDDLRDRVVFGGDVSMVLAYARRGEVAAAAVYATDARGIDDVRVLDVADWPAAPVPEVVVAATSDDAAGRRFLAFLRTPAALAVFARHGFGAP